MTPQERLTYTNKNINSLQSKLISKQRLVKTNYIYASLGGQSQRGESAKTCTGRHWVTDEQSNRLVYITPKGWRDGLRRKNTTND